MGKKTISNAFTVNTVADGESAPYYFDEWFAWSNDTSTANVNVSPTIPSGHTWENSIPNRYATYLWRKSIRNVWDENKRIYITSREAQYYRMTGTDGTSIHMKGSVDYQNSSQGSGTALNLIANPSDGDAYVVGLDLQGNEGWLYQWTTESNSWIPLGQFKGESGTTYYTHVVWATNVVYEGSTITSIEGYTSAKSPNDTTHVWMGVHVDEIPQDPSSGSDVLLLAYTWSYTKGVKGDDGDDGVSYSIDVKPEQVVIGSDATGSNWLGLAYFYKNVGGTTSSHSAYFALYSRSNNGVYTRQGYSRSAVTGIDNSSGDWGGHVTTSTDALVIYIGTSSFGNSSLSNVEPTTYTMKCEIPVLKNGNTGKRGKVGRFFYYAGDFNASDNTPLIVNDAQVPFFSNAGSSGNKYYVFNREETPSGGSMTMAQMAAETSVGGQIQWNKLPWQVVTDDHKYLITEAIFGNFAKFGSAIINGDWMISSYGTLHGPGSTNVYEINSDTSSYTIMGVTYTYRNAYTAFDPDYLNTYHGGYVTFTPYYCVDLKTGETYQQNAHIRGEVHATSGTFTNVSIGGQSTFGGLVKKIKTIITEDNISSYGTYDDAYEGYILDLSKCGTWIEFQNFTSGAMVVLGGISNGNVIGIGSTSEQKKDYTRSLIGNNLLIYYPEQQSGQGVISITGYTRTTDDGSNTSFSLQVGEFAALECKIRPKNNKEDVYWLRAKGNI